MYNLDYLGEIANNTFHYIKGLITLDNNMFLLVLAIFAINYLFKIIALNEKKFELKKNILNIIKLLPIYMTLGSITLIYALAFNINDSYEPLNIRLKYVILIISVFILAYFVLVGIIYKYRLIIIECGKKIFKLILQTYNNRNKIKTNSKTKNDT